MVAPWVPYKGSELPESQGQFYMKRFGFCRVLGYQEKPSKAQENVSLLKVAWDSLRKFPQLTKASASWEQESILEVSHLLLFLTSPTGSAVPPALSHQSITLHPSCSSFTRAQPINGLSSSFFLFFSKYCSCQTYCLPYRIVLSAPFSLHIKAKYLTTGFRLVTQQASASVAQNLVLFPLSGLAQIPCYIKRPSGFGFSCS